MLAHVRGEEGNGAHEQHAVDEGGEQDEAGQAGAGEGDVVAEGEGGAGAAWVWQVAEAAREDGGDDDGDGGLQSEDAAPTDELAEDAADRAGEDLREDDAVEEFGQGDLALGVGHGVGNIGHADRHGGGGGGAGGDAHEGERAEAGGQGAAEQGNGIGAEGNEDDAELAEFVPHRAEHDLAEAIGEGEGGDEDGDGGDGGVEVAGDDVQQRVHHPGGGVAEEGSGGE